VNTNNTAAQLLSRHFGYHAFRGEQERIIAAIVGGQDCLVLMPTGGGKSLCYQLPALLRDGVGVVVSPLIALMQDQVSALEAVGIRAAFLNSALSQREAQEVEARFRAQELDLLYVAPERLMTERFLDLLAQTRVALFAIDEAHCVSQWGHDFRPEYAQLSILHQRFPTVPRVALTATADSLTRAEIIEKLGLEDAQVFVSSFDRPNIHYTIVEKNDPRKQLLKFLRQEHAGDAGIVYCLSRNKVDETSEFLKREGIDAMPYHAGMPSAERAANQTRFLQEDAVVMVATIAFGMGIDKPDVRFVAHLDLPKSIEGYYQETGRAGRDGAPANAWMTYGLQDVVQQRRMIDLSEASEDYKRVSTGKLDTLLGLCETAQCRRGHLLHYFGESQQAGYRCGNCDNCLQPPETFDGTQLMQKLLSCCYRTGQRFGALHVIEVLRGKTTEKVTRFGHDQLSVFGVGADLDDKQWRIVIRQAIALNLLAVKTEAYNALGLTDQSRDVLKGERSLQLRATLLDAPSGSGKAARGKKVTLAPGEAPLGAQEQERFERLRAWRALRAKTNNVPAYVILHDSTLRALARDQPQTLRALEGVAGLGEKRIAQFGDELLSACL
jgi:ATP-dependent DNA helicase RecQ